MTRVSTFFLVQVTLLAVIQPVVGQIDPDLYAYESHKSISIGMDGRPKISERGVYNWKYPFRTFAFISSTEVRKELDLVPRQERAMDSQLRQFEETRLTLAMKRRKENKDIRHDYRIACEQLEENLFAEWVPSQVDRLNEIYWQLEMRKHGLIALVEEYQSKSETKLSPEQLSRISKSMEPLNNDWVGEIREKCKSALDSFETRIPGSDRQQFSQLVQDNPHFLNLDILELTSKRVLEQLESDEKPVDQVTEVEDRLGISEYYQLQADGQWKPLASKGDFPSALVGWIVYAESTGLPELELTDPQLEKLTQLKEEISRRSNESTKTTNEMFDSGADDKEIRGYLDTALESQKQFARDQFFNKIILPHQVRALNDLLDRWDAAKNGPFQFMPKLQNMTDVEKKQYVEALKALRKDIQRIHLNAGEFERRMIRESIEPIDSAAATEILKMIGTKPQHLSFSELLFRSTYQIPAESFGK